MSSHEVLKQFVEVRTVRPLVKGKAGLRVAGIVELIRECFAAPLRQSNIIYDSDNMVVRVEREVKRTL